MGGGGKGAFTAGRIVACAGGRRAHGASVDGTQCRRPGCGTAPARTAAPRNHQACLSHPNLGSCVWDVRLPVRSATSTDGRDACRDPPHVHRSLCRPAWTADGPACRMGNGHPPLSGTGMPAALPGVVLPRPVRGRAWLWSDAWKKPPYPPRRGVGGGVGESAQLQTRYRHSESICHQDPKAPGSETTPGTANSKR